MPIIPPQLDDLRYDRIVTELIRRIPVHAPEWTDHNESDPGITLIQLFAYLAEQITYRLNRIPEKNHIELLKLLGIRLKPARAARTLLALLLANPATLKGFTLPQGARAKATAGKPPPSYETDTDLDIIPAQAVLLLTTVSQELWDLGSLGAGEDPPEDPADNDFLTIIWDGKKPKLKDLPLKPLVLFPKSGQKYLWIGLDYNPDLDAGFLGVRVSLTLQFGDDELPDLAGRERCQEQRPVGEAPPPVDWLHYYDTDAGGLRLLPGRIDDTTEHLNRSGTLRFTVPFSFGPIPVDAYKNLREAVVPSPVQGCQRLAQTLGETASKIASADVDLAQFQSALTTAVSDIQDQATQARPAVPHLLDAQFRDPGKVRGWLRLSLPNNLSGSWQSPRLRMVTFNAVTASNATTVTNELLGRTDGRPGLTFALAHNNILEQIELAIQEDPQAPLVPWRQVDSLDGQAPQTRVFVLDPEAGRLRFGNGIRGRIPPLVPGGGQVVARRYRYGGGEAGEVGVGAITNLESPRAGLAGCVNVAAAQGGADPETLEEAKERARKELSSRSRAVTAGDFVFIAQQTPKVRVGRVAVVPLTRPLAADTTTAAISQPRCGNSLPNQAAGLDLTLVAHGAVTVVVVPDQPGPEPTPTPSFLRRVCEHLNQHRLVTTEVYVVPPQYARICNLRVQVRAEPGYTRIMLQTQVEERLARYLHVLTGGEDGLGYPFGAQLHVADLIAQIFRLPGIDRVEGLTAAFTRTKTNAVPRQGELVLCPASSEQYDRLNLGPEETVSFDATNLTLTTVV